MIKKNWSFFWTATAVFWAAVCAGCLFFWELSAPVTAWLAAAAAVLWGISLAHFYSIRYEFNNSEITIKSGFCIKSTKTVRTESILYESRLKICGIFVCLRLATAGGGALLFCDIRQNISK